MRQNCILQILLLASSTCIACAHPGGAGLGGGALAGNRYRIVISSDIGGSDEDDIQSMIHFLLYADLFDTEGIIASPPHGGRKEDILDVIKLYERDFAKLKTHSDAYPRPDSLRSIAKQGATDPAAEKGFGLPTEGSQWLIHCAKQPDPRPLYVLVWGAVTDVAQALHDDPSIKQKIRVHFIASWNQRQDPRAFAYIDQNHPDCWFIHNDTSFRGWYVGGRQDEDLGNRSFVSKHARGHGALGERFAGLKGGSIKMGDTPTVAFLLRGTPDDPRAESWGGSFVKKEGRHRWWIDNPHSALAHAGRAGAKTVNKWREQYLRDFQRRFDRCLPRSSPMTKR